jgi:hypothetical protein
LGLISQLEKAEEAVTLKPLYEELLRNVADGKTTPNQFWVIVLYSCPGTERIVRYVLLDKSKYTPLEPIRDVTEKLSYVQKLMRAYLSHVLVQRYI